MLATIVTVDRRYIDAIEADSISQSVGESCNMHNESIHRYCIPRVRVRRIESLIVAGRASIRIPDMRSSIVSLVVFSTIGKDPQQ